MLTLLVVASLCCGCFVVERWGNGALPSGKQS
jgi:hypothetical protein